MIKVNYGGVHCKVDYDGFNLVSGCHELYIATPIVLSDDDCNDLANQVANVFIEDVLKPALRDSADNMGLPEGITLHSFCAINVTIGMENVQTYAN